MSGLSSRFVTRSASVNIMTSAIAKAIRGLVRDFNEVERLQVSQKGPGDFVSAADLRVEKVLLEELLRAKPEYGILAEETGSVQGKDEKNRWIVDPIDGTTNFLHGIPHFAITIALERQGEIIAGVTYDIIKDELFWAEKGMGAYLNDRRLRVSSRTQLNEALVVTGVPFAGHGNMESFQRILGQVMPKVAGVRRFGAASLDLAYVAAGRFEVYWEADVSPWDIAAGVILVQEAGGYVSDLEGGQEMLEKKSILAGTSVVHGQFLEIVRAAQ